MAPANNNNIEKSQTYNTSIKLSFTIRTLTITVQREKKMKNAQKVVACCVFENEYRERDRKKYCANLL